MTSTDITQLLRSWTDGDEKSLEQLTPLVYEQLHQIADRVFRNENAAHTLQPTALVNEAFLQMVNADVDWQNRSHFFALAARMMRRILVNHAKSKHAAKRGGNAAKVLIDDVALAAPEVGEELLNLDEAISQLAAIDARKADVLELHYFGGLTYEEMSEVLGLSSSTLDREIRFARAWLRAKLDE